VSARTLCACVRACTKGANDSQRSATNSHKLTVTSAYRSLPLFLSFSLSAASACLSGRSSGLRVSLAQRTIETTALTLTNDETSAPHGGSDTTDGRASARAAAVPADARERSPPRNYPTVDGRTLSRSVQLRFSRARTRLITDNAPRERRQNNHARISNTRATTSPASRAQLARDVTFKMDDV